MNAGDKIPAALSPARRRVRRWRMAGLAVLLLGLAGAGAVCWLGTRAANLGDDISMAGYSKAETRQMGLLYGQQGLLIENLQDDLKQPGTQAIIIIIGAAIIAAGVFYFARILELEADDAEAAADKARE
jgi:hypothetical protein